MAVLPVGSLVTSGPAGIGVPVLPGDPLDILTSAGPDVAPTFSPPAIVINSSWPINALFIACIDTDPSELFGFGTWEFQFTGKLFIGDNAIEVWTWKRTA